MKVDFMQVWACLFCGGLLLLTASLLFFVAQFPLAVQITGFMIFAFAGAYVLHVAKKFRDFNSTLSFEQEKILLHDEGDN